MTTKFLLSPDQARALKALSRQRLSYRVLAERFNISVSSARNYAHVYRLDSENRIYNPERDRSTWGYL